ncbi:TIGR03086 family protein [Mycobacteroides abscessus subsp. abscessus]|nr:TIGR03086 family protein [Mycobacteroides abscessus subsp. abscessus]
MLPIRWALSRRGGHYAHVPGMCAGDKSAMSCRIHGGLFVREVEIPSGQEPVMTTALNPLETVANARAALHEVVSRLTEAYNDKQTPNAKFTVAQLTDHLQNSIKLLGGAAGVDIALTTEGSVADRLLPQSQAVVDAWQRRGIDGTVTLPIGEYPAEVAVRILGSEFLVHAWDYAVATGQEFEPMDALTDGVLESVRMIIQPERRDGDFFADEVPVPDDSPNLVKLIAFTGRNPGWSPAS